MTIEQKAAAYDEAIKRAKDFMNGEVNYELKIGENIMCWVFPELRESEDERIRKSLIILLQHFCKGYRVPGLDFPVSYKDMLDWLEKQGESDETKAKMFLINKGYPIDANGKFPTYEEMYNIIKDGLEKQGEQKPTIEMKSAEESLGIDSETYNKIVDECIYGENKPTDKVEPKFKVGQTIKKEGFNSGFPIVKIENGFYYNDMGDNFPFTDQDNWKLVEQKPADWSEEDEDIIQALDACIDATIKNGMNYISFDSKSILIEKVKNWLKSLKYRYTWKPSEEEMEALRKAEATIGVNHVVLAGLISDLEKLKG